MLKGLYFFYYQQLPILPAPNGRHSFRHKKMYLSIAENTSYNTLLAYMLYYVMFHTLYTKYLFFICLEPITFSTAAEDLKWKASTLFILKIAINLWLKLLVANID